MSALTIKNTDEFDQQVLQSERPVLVDFWAPWCGPCKMVAPELEKVAKSYEGKVAVVKVNVDELSSLAGQYKVMGIPTLLIFKQGQEVHRLVGFRPGPEISAALDEVL